MNKTNYNCLISIKPEKIEWFPTIGLKLINACRLKCEFCCEPNRKGPIYSIKEFEVILDFLWNNGTKRICLTGGEPLLYPHLLELLKLAKSKGFYTLLLTADGTLLKANFKKINLYVDGIRLSIHGLHEIHDKVVGKSNVFKDIESCIDLIKSSNIDLFASTVVTNENKINILKIAEWCEDKKIEKFYLYGLLKSGLGELYSEKYGMPCLDEFDSIVGNLNLLYQNKNLKIRFYDYRYNAECILIYGNGDVIIDPYFDSINFQLKIGNLNFNTKDEIWMNFQKDKTNLKGYTRHLQNAIG